jgi:hypothetical protein
MPAAALLPLLNQIPTDTIITTDQQAALQARILALQGNFSAPEWQPRM